MHRSIIKLIIFKYIMPDQKIDRFKFFQIVILRDY